MYTSWTVRDSDGQRCRVKVKAKVMKIEMRFWDCAIDGMSVQKGIPRLVGDSRPFSHFKDTANGRRRVYLTMRSPRVLNFHILWDRPNVDTNLLG